MALRECMCEWVYLVSLPLCNAITLYVFIYQRLFENSLEMRRHILKIQKYQIVEFCFQFSFYFLQSYSAPILIGNQSFFSEIKRNKQKKMSSLLLLKKIIWHSYPFITHKHQLFNGTSIMCNVSSMWLSCM